MNNSPVPRPPLATLRSAAAALKASRRRSNTGPMCIETARRPSSLCPPTHANEDVYLGESAPAPATEMRRPSMGCVDEGLAARNLRSLAEKKRMLLLSLAEKGTRYSSRARHTVRASCDVSPKDQFCCSAETETDADRARP